MAHYAMATRCVVYFLFPCFSDGLTVEDIEGYIEQGEYMWLDYAQSHWLEHFGAACGVAGNEMQTLERLLRAFVHRWRRSSEEGSLVWNRKISFGFDISKPVVQMNTGRFLVRPCTNPKVQLWMSTRVNLIHGFPSSLIDTDATPDPFILQSFCKGIWRQLEIIMDSKSFTDRTKTQLQEYYGFDVFRCDEVGCSRFADPFRTALERDTHRKHHERPFKCSDDSCEYSSHGFVSASAVSKHMKAHQQIQSAADSLSNIRLADTLTTASQILPLKTGTTWQIRTSWDLLCDSIVADDLPTVEDILRNISKLDLTSWPKRDDQSDAYQIHADLEDGYYYLICVVSANFYGSDNPLLILAIQHGAIDSLRWLLEQGFGKVDVNEVLPYQSKPLRYSNGYNYDDILNRIISHPSFGRFDKVSELTPLLLTHGANASPKLLKMAIQKKSSDLVRMLFQYGADPNGIDNSNTMLNCAIISSDENMVNLLLDYGAELHPAERYPPLMDALRHANIVKLLLDRGANPNLGYQKITPLAEAISNSSAKQRTFFVTKMLLNAGADPHIQVKNKFLANYLFPRNFLKNYGITWDEFVRENYRPLPPTSPEEADELLFADFIPSDNVVLLPSLN